MNEDNSPINPDLPESDGQQLTTSEASVNSIFNHKTVIAPLHPDIVPEETAPRPTVADAGPSEPSAQSDTGLTGSLPQPPAITTAIPESAPTVLTPSFGSSQASPTASTPIFEDGTEARGVRLKELLIVTAVSATAGAIYHLWHLFTVAVLPNAISVCSNAGNNGISLACRGTLAGNFFAYITLFTLTGYVAQKWIRKSNLLAFLYAGLFVCELSFMQEAFLLDFGAQYRWRWLIGHGLIWNAVLLPAIIAAIMAPTFYGLTSWKPRRTRPVLGGLLVVLICLMFVFMPTSARTFTGSQSQTGLQNREADFRETVKNSSLKLYAPRDYTGILKLESAQATLKSDYEQPNYALNFNLDTSYPNQEDRVVGYIYNATENGFDPPNDCGQGWAASKVDSTSNAKYPCKVVLRTKHGRTVYGYRSPSKLERYNIDPNSDDIRKIQPDEFYVPLGDEVISFSDTALNYENDSALTPQEVEQFVDSLEPVSGSALDSFINKYMLFK